MVYLKLIGCVLKKCNRSLGRPRLLKSIFRKYQSITPARVKDYENSERIVASKYFPTLVEPEKKAEPTAIMTLPYTTRNAIYVLFTKALIHCGLPIFRPLYCQTLNDFKIKVVCIYNAYPRFANIAVIVVISQRRVAGYGV